MKKILVPALIAAAITVILAASVFSQQGAPQEWDEAELVTLEGMLTDVGRPIVTIEVENEVYFLHLGPAEYWQEKGYTFEKGQTLKITGVLEDIYGRIHVYPQDIESAGKSIVLTDDANVPYKAYSGYGSGCDWHGSGRVMHGWRGYGCGHMGARSGSGRGGMMCGRSGSRRGGSGRVSTTRGWGGSRRGCW